MLSLSTTHTHIRKSHYPSSRLNYPLTPSPIFECNPKKRGGNYKKAAVLNRFFGFKEVGLAWRFERNLDNSWCCWCKQSEGDAELEAEIMDFMAKSEKPTMFPTREELMRAGRVDLVEAIKKRGGWYSLGWDEKNVGDNVEGTMDFDIEEFQRRVESCKESASLREHCDDSLSSHHKEDGSSSQGKFISGNLDSLQLAASASLGRSLEIGADEETGIEGILSRLEKQRNSDFGIDLPKYGYEAHAESKDEGDDKHFDTSLDVARTDFGENGRLPPDINQGILNTSNGKISTNTDPETWRTWSYRRAGFQHTEFEAAEISLSKNEVETDKGTYYAGIAVTNEEYDEAQINHEEINHHEIQARLQHLE
ncbi:hypothetical protein CDL12_12146 [Handroanthus impetiginosus]|uniref:Uncharacterized protein n=1 Tax=Handroanthus impetiginosus TaxID=429701 RepID=A0A2G9HCG8_9LAMI|nr:hypothetical protein CDL12_12146 [Handroanthus impetiginosus]